MSVHPFSIFKRADRTCYSVSFKDANGKYLPPVSTGKKTEKEAMQAALKMLYEGIPQKKKADTTVMVENLSLKNAIRKIKTDDEAESILAELKRLGWVKGFILNNTPQSEDFLIFLTTFWDWEASPYIREKLRKNHSIHKRYCKLQNRAVTMYWEPFFTGRFLGDITATDIDNFINHMGEKDLSAARKNVVIKAGTKPLRWAFSKGKIEKDPTRGHIMFSEEERKRNILTPTTAAAVFRAVWNDERIKLANMLAAVTGMRNGEIIALRFQDLGSNCLYVQHSFNRADGMKPPKNNETRTVEIPFPDLMNGLIEQAKENPWGASPDSFVFWSTSKKGVPMDGQCFVKGLREALIQVGFPKDDTDKYTFHSWRHFYTSYMIGKLDKKLLKSQTGHRTDEMLTHYGNHETDKDRETIQAVSKETFAGLLPEKPQILVFKKSPIAEVACG